MPFRELGHLAKAQKEGDVVKKKVDSAIKESEKSIKNLKLKDREAKLTELYSRCSDASTEVSQLLVTVKELKEEDEPKAIKGFDTKKTNEIKRLEQFKTRLEAALANFPEEVRPDVEKPGADNEEEEEDDGETGEEEDEDDEEEDDDEDDEEESEEGEDTLEQPAQPSGGKQKLEVKNEDNKAEVKASIMKGKQEDEDDDNDEGDEENDEDEEDDEEEDDDDEDEEEDEEGEDDDEEDEEEEEEEDEMEFSSTMRLFEAISDYEKEQPEDLSFKKGEILTIVNTSEDGWWEAVNKNGDKGIVPKTYLKLHNKYKHLQETETLEADEVITPTGKRSAKELWKGIKTALTETSVSDVLHAMGAIPSGFRPSTLAHKFKDEFHRMKHFLAPKLSTSNVTYRDLFIDPSRNRIRERTVWIEKTVTLTACRQIPPPGAGLEVIDRRVRVCLFDGENILSNIHCIQVSSVDRSQRTWNFSTKLTDNMDTFKHAEIFVRTSHNVSNLELLFELSIVYERTSTGERGELSCGWSTLPLVEPDGSCVVNRGYDMYVNGGTPYEHGVEVDPSISRRAASSALMSLVSGNKQPRIVARVSAMKQYQKEWLETLPDTIIGSTCLLNFYAYYRHLLADNLIRERIDLDSTEPIHSPVLVNFPIVADQLDIMTFFRECWQEQVKKVSYSDKRDEEYVKSLFQKVFMESVYPVMMSASIPAYKEEDPDVAKERQQEIRRFKLFKQDHNSMLAALCSQEINFLPFQMSEVSFSVIGRHCLDRPIHVKAS
ncbi:nephrocystin-1-like [Liolophura sinensis]|uniref:nephrocystin-1-like n=1 Tax=Liolophura sinensis TaxID=3198878 RepID=UPI0031597300